MAVSRLRHPAHLLFVVLFAAAAMSAAEATRQPSFEDLAARAESARNTGRLDDALRLYRTALEARPSWHEGRWYVATILYEMDRHAEARDAFAEVLRHQPDHAGAAGLKGLCEFQLRRFDQALIDLLQAREMGISRSPAIATVVRYHAAVLLTRIGEVEMANQMLTEFATESVDSAQVIEAFGINLLRMPVLPAEVQPEARD